MQLIGIKSIVIESNKVFYFEGEFSKIKKPLLTALAECFLKEN